MLELTNLDDLPIFFDYDSIEAVEQQEECSVVTSKTGKFYAVKENASTIFFEIKSYKEEQNVNQLTQLALGLQS
jgi:uncharacterized protein YlzI (FlbEa/FlbD family)